MRVWLPRRRKLSVSQDFDEHVIRLGYSDFDAMEALQQAGRAVRHSPGLRTFPVIVNNKEFIFTPAALYLERTLRLTESALVPASAPAITRKSAFLMPIVRLDKHFVQRFVYRLPFSARLI